MDHLKGYLERFKKIKNPKEDRLTLLLLLKEFINKDHVEIDINLKKDIIFIKKSSPVLRNFIYLNKQEILSFLKSRTKIRVDDLI